MKLIRLTLCPFAGFSNHSVTFSEGLNLMYGSNELGKSTLYNAIHTVLFVSTQLSKNSVDYKSLQSYYPLHAKHDFISIELQFESANKIYTLTKKWSGNKQVSSSVLRSADEHYSTPDTVDQRMSEILRLNRATWEHILFVKQSSIAESTDQLRANKNSLDALSHASIQQLNDVDPQQLLVAIQQIIKEYEDRWDRLQQKPQNGRGLDNPWANPGKIATQWYVVEKIIVNARNMDRIEKEFDAVNIELQQLNGLLQPILSYLDWAKPLSTSLSKRIELENKIFQCREKINPLSITSAEWKKAMDQLPLIKERVEEKNKSVQSIANEITIAEKRKKLNELQSDYLRLQEIKNSKDALEHKISSLTQILEEDWNKANTTYSQLQEALLTIKALALKVELHTLNSTEIELKTGEGAPQKISLSANDSKELRVNGYVSLQHNGLTILVKNDVENIDQLRLTIDQANAKLNSLYKKYQVDQFDELSTKYKLQQQMFTELKTFERDFQLLLRDRTFEQWNQSMTELSSLPATREFDVLQQLNTEENSQLTLLQKDVLTTEEVINKYTQQFKTWEDLNQQVIELTSENLLLKKEIETLEPLPDGFANATDFQKNIERKQFEKDQLNEKIVGLNQRKILLENSIQNEEFTLNELREKWKLEDAKLKHLQKESQLLHRLQERISLLLTNQKNDPYEEVHAEMQNLLKLLTQGKYTSLSEEHGVPTGVNAQNGSAFFPVSSLSTGMRGTLAIATRLAFAKKYMQDMYGFLLMDDPLTELDEQRAMLAAQVIEDFSSQKQVILLTCQKEHVQLFKTSNALNYQSN